MGRLLRAWEGTAIVETRVGVSVLAFVSGNIQDGTRLSAWGWRSWTVIFRTMGASHLSTLGYT